MNASEGTQLWSERYDRDLDDIFAIQDEITRGIVEQLKVKLGLGAQATTQLVARPTDDLEAYQFYLRGREAVWQRTPRSLRRGIDFFRQALARDADYARAYLGVAEAYIGLGVYQYVAPDEARREADAALSMAQRLQPDLPLVHTLRAQLKVYLRVDWATADADLSMALARDPNDSLAHAYRAVVHGMLGNWATCAAAARRAIEADPLSPFVRAVSTMTFFAEDDSGADAAAALIQHDIGLDLEPASVINLWIGAMRLADLGRLDEAVVRMTRAVELAQRSPLLLGLLGRVYALAGRRADAMALRDELVSRARTEYVGPAAFLVIDAALGDEDMIAESLRANIEAGTGPVSLAVSGLRHEITPLLDHPRLGALVRQLSLYAGLPGAASASVGGVRD
jgi:eukaryotic-like serine/threonine-protein kinase